MQIDKSVIFPSLDGSRFSNSKTFKIKAFASKCKTNSTLCQVKIQFSSSLGISSQYVRIRFVLQGSLFLKRNFERRTSPFNILKRHNLKGNKGTSTTYTIQYRLP